MRISRLRLAFALAFIFCALPGFATVAHDTTASGSNSAGTSFSITVSTGAAGEELVCAVTANAGITVSSVSGGSLTWSKVSSHLFSGTVESEIWAAYASSKLSSASITVTLSGAAPCSGVIDSFSGTATSGAVEVATATEISSATTWTGSVTTVTNNALVAAYNFSFNGSNPTFSAGSGYTISSTPNTGTAATSGEYKNAVTGTAGAVSPTFTASASSNGVVYGLSIKPSASASILPILKRALDRRQ